jgi:hypothetical protein
VLLQLDRRLGEDGGLNVSSGGLDHQPVLVLVELANAKAEIIVTPQVFSSIIALHLHKHKHTSFHVILCGCN